MSDALRDVIRREIEQSPHRRIPFRRFMELALYHPRWGYYCREGVKIGREGDFFTSSSLGEVFGKTIGAWLGRLSKQWGSNQPWWLIEAGPGDGRLMQHVLAGLVECGESLPQGCGLVEISPWHRRLQAERLQASPVPVYWLETPEDLPKGGTIALLSNEFFDAFPVHRLIGSMEGIQEKYVSWKREQLVEVEGPVSDPACLRYLQTMDWPPLQEGMEAEIPLDAGRWYRRWTAGIDSGWIITIDYGGTTTRLVHNQQGTLRGYRRHQLVKNPLESPGETDLTADVHFSALQQWGMEGGWKTIFFDNQLSFLHQAGILDQIQPAFDANPFSAAAKQNRAIRQLALPGGMGEAFQVLIQVKGALSDPFEF
ncbi:class I SAM-dependent methyltransferase [Desmospora activa]|uniref:SAM-dependent MidA family methyltransferase n=1 Tax=Desmospora activa DSM 45169 TaxID=1121389 RepID=A0A2T4ZBH2_9BACL|nr:SAM-dependent methyltransferase [Desmospora activa]PTM59244.1 SAM-dependent MidA family methyltransferase [Desmospora activa DSM 45169]